MRYKTAQEAQDDHINNYRSDGIIKQIGNPYQSSYNRYKFIMSNVPNNSYVLDVGCNGGTLGVPLIAHKQCYVKGIDIVEDLVIKAKKRGVYAEQGQAEDLSRYKSDDFDVVICSEVLEHLYDPFPAIKEAYRVLKPGGKYIATVPHPSGAMADNTLGDYHNQNFTLETLDTLFYNHFERDAVKMYEITYVEAFCKANSINPEQPQWLGLIGTKEKK